MADISESPLWDEAVEAAARSRFRNLSNLPRDRPDNMDLKDANAALRAALDVLFERHGTYLDPAAYGQNYDHHTMTTMDTKEGVSVALWRLRTRKEAG